MTGAFYTPSEKTPEERAILVGVTLPGDGRSEEIENLRELELLVKTAGAEVVGSSIQNRTRIDGSTYIGGGKLEELAAEVHRKGVNLVIFDDDLSPAQARNVENYLNVNVVDRTEVILDIFARRARTRQARIQVEIAQLTYALPRLRRLWDHLSRQAGGIGTRGPGESQLEVDRRRVRERIAALKRALRKISRGVEERRKRRGNVFNATIVGYTNAGKSTLLNRLAGSRVTESGRLFSTLDSTTRRVRLPDGKVILLTDTIGFIRKLPAHLVASFRATLLDVMEADLLLHVVDVSNPRHEEYISVVNSVLEKILDGRGRDNGGGSGVPTVLVLNKIDVFPDPTSRDKLSKRHPGAAIISASSGEGTTELLLRITVYMEGDTIEAEVVVLPEDGRAIAAVEESSKVLKRRVIDGRLVFDVRVPRKHISMLEKAGSVRLKPLGSG